MRTLSEYRAEGDPEGPIDHSNRWHWCDGCYAYIRVGRDEHNDRCWEQRYGEKVEHGTTGP